MLKEIGNESVDQKVGPLGRSCRCRNWLTVDGRGKNPRRVLLKVGKDSCFGILPGPGDFMAAVTERHELVNQSLTLTQDIATHLREVEFGEALRIPPIYPCG